MTDFQLLKAEIAELRKQFEEFKDYVKFDQDNNELSEVRILRRLDALEQFKSECEFVGLPYVATSHQFRRKRV